MTGVIDAVIRPVIGPVIRPVVGGDDLAPNPIFRADLLNSLIPSVAVAPTPTFTRGDTDATIIDFEGLLKDVTANEARFKGARRVENLFTDSEDFSTANWNVFAATKTGATTIDGIPCMEINFQANALAALFQNAVVQLGPTHAMRAKVRAKTGTVTLRLSAGAQLGDFSSDITVGTTWTEIGFTDVGSVLSAANSSIRNGSAGVSQDFYIANIQAEIVSGQAKQDPSEYVSNGAGDDHGANQDGVKYFNTQNGNSLSAPTGGTLTEATGAAIADATLKGVMVEEQRTNLEFNSEDYSAWVQAGGVVVTTNTTIGPRGELTADTISDPGVGFASVRGSFTPITGGNDVTASIFILKDSVPAATRFCLLRVALSGGAGMGVDLTFDTSTGQTATRIQAGSPTNISSGVESVGNYWRFRVSFTSAVSNSSMTQQFYPAIGAGLITGAYNTNTSGSVVAGGSQNEEGAFETSYIPTTGAGATRNAELLSYPNSNIANAEGTYAMHFTPNANTSEYLSSGNRPTLGVRGASADLLFVGNAGGELIQSDGANLTGTTAMPSLVAHTTVKLAGRWSAVASLQALRQDGTQDEVAFDGSINISTAITIGFAGFSRTNGAYRSLRIYDEALDDVNFAGLTA